MPDDCTGRLLVATPGLHDGNFDRTVVLVLEHTASGALGVVLTRPTDQTVAHAVPAWAAALASPAVLFSGGPVDPTAMLALGRCTPHPSTEGIVPIDAELATVDIAVESPALIAAIGQLRLFSGYSGWSAGQLDQEIVAGAWLVCDRHSGDPFTNSPEHLWGDVMARTDGALESLATAVPQPWLN